MKIPGNREKERKALDAHSQVPNTNEPHHDKTNKMACAPSENSEQSGHHAAQSDKSLRTCAQWVAKDSVVLLRTDSNDS